MNKVFGKKKDEKILMHKVTQKWYINIRQNQFKEKYT